MPSLFPCPNNQCTYQFDAEILPPSAMVTCPLCRTKFPYRASRTAASQDRNRTANEPAKATGPRVVNIRDMPKEGGPLTIVLWVGGALVVIGTIVAVLVTWSQKPSGLVRISSGKEQVDERLNLRLDPFPAGWEDDTTTRDAISANIFGRRRNEPGAWAAMVAKDFGDHDPRPAELDELMIPRVRKMLTAPTHPSLDNQTWAGQPARSIQFSGDWDGVQVRGEAHAIGNKGIGYVFFVWSSERDWEATRGELAGLREKFKFLKARSDWEPKEAATKVYSPELAKYRIEDTDAIWILAKPGDQWSKKPRDPKLIVDDPKEFDASAKMILFADYQSALGGDSKRKAISAMAMLAEFAGSGNALQAAQAHVLARIKRDYPDLTEDLKLEPFAKGIALPAGGPAIGKFRFQSPLDRQDRDIWVIAAIVVDSQVVAIEIKCKEEHATYLDEWMVHLAGSLKSK